MNSSHDSRTTRLWLDLLEDRQAPAIGFLSSLSEPLLSALPEVPAVAAPLPSAVSSLTTPLTDVLPDLEATVALDLAALPLPLDLALELSTVIGSEAGLLTLDSQLGTTLLGQSVDLGLASTVLGDDGLLSVTSDLAADLLGQSLAVTLDTAVVGSEGLLSLGTTVPTGGLLDLGTNVNTVIAPASGGLLDTSITLESGGALLSPIVGSLPLPGGIVEDGTTPRTGLPGAEDAVVGAALPGGTATLVGTPPANDIVLFGPAPSLSLSDDASQLANTLLARLADSLAAEGLDGFSDDLLEPELFSLDTAESDITPTFAAIALTALTVSDDIGLLVAPEDEAPSGPNGHGTPLPISDQRGDESLAADRLAGASGQGLFGNLLQPAWQSLAELEAALVGLVHRLGEMLPGGSDAFLRWMPMMLAALAALAAVRVYRRRLARRQADEAAGLPMPAGLAPGLA